MASVNDAKNALEKRAESGALDLTKRVEAMKHEIAQVLPKNMGLDPERMVRIGLTLIRRTPKLSLVQPLTFLGAFMTCNQLGLEPGPALGHAWIIPREVYDKGQPTGLWEANFQLGYKGAIVLARRSGEIAKIVCRTVYDNEVADDQFAVEYNGADEVMRHKPILIGTRGKAVLYYCAAKLTNGEQTFTPLRPEEVEEQHRKVGRAANSPAWTTHYEQMAHKSCIIRARRFWPSSVDLEVAVAVDGMVRTDTKPEALQEAANTPDWVDGEATDWPTPAPVPPSLAEEKTAGQ